MGCEADQHGAAGEPDDLNLHQVLHALERGAEVEQSRGGLEGHCFVEGAVCRFLDVPHALVLRRMAGQSVLLVPAFTAVPVFQ